MVVDPQHRYLNDAQSANKDIYDDFKLNEPFDRHGLYETILVL